jgi:hypothetical protein
VVLLEHGSFTAAVFDKSFNDYIQYGNYTREFTNNGVPATVIINGPDPGDGAKLKGFEVAYQRSSMRCRSRGTAWRSRRTTRTWTTRA